VYSNYVIVCLVAGLGYLGPGDDRPTARQIITKEELHGKWTDKTVLITGCSSGIGVETAKALLETGATLYLTARDLAKAKVALGDILQSGRAHLLELDLDSLESVRKCADAFLAKSDRLNLLIANAGVMATPEGRTADGFETQFGTNHLAHFLLIQLLLPTILRSTRPEYQSRVVILSSQGHRHRGINFPNLSLEGEYHPWSAYAQSKTANIYTANELERRYKKQGLHALAVHPGLIQTGLLQFVDEETLKHWGTDSAIRDLTKSVEQGAATTVWAATAKALEGVGGIYLEDCQIGKPAKAEPADIDPGYAPHAFDEAKEAQLWEKSMELVAPFLA
jgi:NAD(P)-dependent dehydrogenase (short-subunit alcohol dehydrogenase family)